MFESLFRDAGYDVTDFYKIAPRYGTNDDLRSLCIEAKKRDIQSEERNRCLEEAHGGSRAGEGVASQGEYRRAEESSPSGDRAGNFEKVMTYGYTEVACKQNTNIYV